MRKKIIYLLLATACVASCGQKKGTAQNAEGAAAQSETVADDNAGPSDPYQALVGTKFQDFSLPDADGNTHKLSEFIGEAKQGRRHYVLVDFWASWCRPCMMELPNVKNNWEEYRQEGFDVVGVSLDSKKDDWQKAVKENGYDWTQLCDFAGFDSPAVSLYKLEYIPWNFLCDEQGTIIAVNLRGNELSAKLKQLFR